MYIALVLPSMHRYQLICVDREGNIFVSDTGNLRIRRISPEGMISTVAGGGSSGANDVLGPEARLDVPCGTATVHCRLRKSQDQKNGGRGREKNNAMRRPTGVS